ERVRLEEKLRRLKRSYHEVEITTEEYQREKILTEAALAAVGELPGEKALDLGNGIVDMVKAWQQATKEEKRDILRLMLDAVYVDMQQKKVVALSPKPPFLPLFNLEEPVRAGDKVLVTGDPDGGRGVVCNTQPI
ncbi:hypothetical protein ACFLWX_03770, partial [Chloroflexota bacterium]